MKIITVLHAMVLLTLSTIMPSHAFAPSDADLHCNNPLLKAAELDDVDALTKELCGGCNVNAATSEGFTALICASDAGSSRAVKYLLEQGANPNLCTHDLNHCPLWYAAMGNHPEAMRYLIKKGANVEAIVGMNGNTILAWSLRTGKTEAVKVLVDAGANIERVLKKEYYGGETAYQIAKKEGHKKAISIIETAPKKKRNNSSELYGVDSIANKLFTSKNYLLEHSHETIRFISKKDLRIIKNTIFARKNYKFESEDLLEYFQSKFSSYKPLTKKIKLSDTDKNNLNYIKRMEEYIRDRDAAG